MKITLIICNKNEGRSIRSIIRAAKKYVDDVLVIDGHSTDKSCEIAKKEGAYVLTDNGKGKGAAIRQGIASATGDILVFMDADGSHNPQDIPLLIRPILQNSADLVLGSRTRGGSDELNGSIEKTIRMIGNVIITQVINSRFKMHITDSQNGFRAIRKLTAKNIQLSENTFSIEGEMVLKVLRCGYRIYEVPTHENARLYGHSRIRLTAVGLRCVWCLLKNIL